jgi:maleylacetoacetate isomerase/maleylpyruvate isomerase
MKFFSFWRSLASFRLRIALNLKGLVADVVFVDLDADAHRAEAYRSVNPQMALPALVLDDGTTLFQSLAIIEYLDELHPTPPLLPADALGRARVRGLALMVACEGHPLLVPRVRRYLDHELNLRDTQQAAWRRHWTVETLAALEGHLAGDKATGRFCHGDTPTLADLCLVGHVHAAVMQQIDLAPYPTVKRIFETAMALPAFAKAHPLVQPDTPEAMRVKK